MINSSNPNNKTQKLIVKSNTTRSISPEVKHKENNRSKSPGVQPTAYSSPFGTLPDKKESKSAQRPNSRNKTSEAKPVDKPKGKQNDQKARTEEKKKESSTQDKSTPAKAKENETNGKMKSAKEHQNSDKANNKDNHTSGQLPETETLVKREEGKCEEKVKERTKDNEANLYENLDVVSQVNNEIVKDPDPNASSDQKEESGGPLVTGPHGNEMDKIHTHQSKVNRDRPLSSLSRVESAKSRKSVDQEKDAKIESSSSNNPSLGFDGNEREKAPSLGSDGIESEKAPKGKSPRSSASSSKSNTSTETINSRTSKSKDSGAEDTRSVKSEKSESSERKTPKSAGSESKSSIESGNAEGGEFKPDPAVSDPGRLYSLATRGEWTLFEQVLRHTKKDSPLVTYVDPVSC